MNAAAPVHPKGGSGSSSWQLILADLALILFLVTLSALPRTAADAAPGLADRLAPAQRPRAEIAAAQALYRPVAGGPSLGEWLASQPHDPRATLTIFALHPAGGEAAAWEAARRLAASARSSGVPVRTIITSAARADLYASLAYDAEVSTTGG
ncbi:hypothetical protein [Erythrobacter tepidarius]|uniref:hypothetical protein n=1 Tax=Erythrobacter tepidarius TaxID=60454 RepID=UPI000A38C16D|nr:hypothetical protein [Erythrobacter tepidarius]